MQGGHDKPPSLQYSMFLTSPYVRPSFLGHLHNTHSLFAVHTLPSLVVVRLLTNIRKRTLGGQAKAIKFVPRNASFLVVHCKIILASVNKCLRCVEWFCNYNKIHSCTH